MRTPAPPEGSRETSSLHSPSLPSSGGGRIEIAVLLPDVRGFGSRPEGRGGAFSGARPLRPFPRVPSAIDLRVRRPRAGPSLFRDDLAPGRHKRQEGDRPGPRGSRPLPLLFDNSVVGQVYESKFVSRNLRLRTGLRSDDGRGFTLHPRERDDDASRSPVRDSGVVAYSTTQFRRIDAKSKRRQKK